METDRLRQLVEEQLRASRQLKARVAELEDRLHAPLAVVSTAVRLPGGITTPRQYRDLLLSEDSGREADSLVTAVPEDRPRLGATYDPAPGTPGKSLVNRAAFLNDIAYFDAAFFGISQWEASSLDPQQRMLLEVTWEALERAGIAARRQDRLPVGVFIGMMAAEYTSRLTPGGDLTGIDPYYASGGGLCFAAGRISYALGLCGPALTLDTACSSSLVAMHLGAQALRRGECRYAVVGGANLVLGPELMVALSQSQALAPDGKCKTFQADADGYGRGEGVGVAVLMRLADAEAERRPIMAVLRGSAVNHDGASSGLTVPSGPAQQEVVRLALADARIDPADVGYVESHGTGTALGDPIEVGALDTVIGTGAGQRQAPVQLGSVKGRIGHLEAAAGIAAVIKVALMLQAGVIPAAIPRSATRLNPLIPWDRIAITVPDHTIPWPESMRRKIAGVSAFGLSGTNAHALLESYEPVAEPPSGPVGQELLLLSAKSPAALGELGAALRGALRTLTPQDVPSVCHTLRAGRVHFGHRIAVLGSSPAELEAGLGVALASIPEPVQFPKNSRMELHALPAQAKQVIEHLAAAFPALAGAAPDGEPVSRLRAIIALLGIRTRLPRTGPTKPEAGASLRAADLTLPLDGQSPDETRALLLAALASLYRYGLDLRLDLLAAPGARLMSDLPTYAFQRRRFWIDERANQGDPLAPLTPMAAPPRSAAAERIPGDAESVRAFLHGELVKIMKSEAALDVHEPFLDVGGDSFVAMMLSKSIELTYGVQLPAEDFPVELSVGEFVGRVADQLIGSGTTDNT